MTEEKRKVGRPPKFKTPEEMLEKAIEYFEDCPDKFTKQVDGRNVKIPCPTITGLTLYLGFCDRHSFYDYESGKPEFSHTIKKIRGFIEKEYEMQLRHGNVAGAIFALKNVSSSNWKDKVEVDNHHSGSVLAPQICFNSETDSTADSVKIQELDAELDDE